MSYGFLDIAITPSVKAAQAKMGTAAIWERDHQRESDRFSEDEIAFIGERDSFYMATVSETGWPYMQHRGGPKGFLKVLDDKTLAFADFRGNRQYLSLGNIGANDRACLFLMDYPHRARLKIYVHVEEFVDADLAKRVTVEGYKAKVERVLRMRLEAFDWNCPQHITPRFTPDELSPLRDRLEQLETENAALEARLAGAGSSH
ncbi:MAG TPA: pyridoxamine 5'-phosphate oxidase family protein [Kofleriaceae bacterium]